MRQVKTSEDVAKRWAMVSFWSVTFAGGLAMFYLVSSLLSRPWYSSTCSLGFGMLWHYLTQPDSWWHQSQHTENQFWMLLTFLMTCAWMFAPDSPYLVTNTTYFSPTVGLGVGLFVVGGCTTAAHYIDRRAHRSRLLDTPLKGTKWAEVRRSTASESASNAKLESILIELVRQLGETSLSTLWNYGKYVRIEREIFSVFRDCTKEELNYVVCTHEMKLLVYKLKNHNKSAGSSLDLATLAITSEFGRLNRNRSQLMDLLANTRVSDLGIPARVVVLDIISSLRMTAHPNTRIEAELWVSRILTTIKGDDLSELKQLVDNKGNAESMHKLIWIDVNNQETRRKILAHFEQQARTQAAQMLMGSSLARRRLLKGPWRKILSDVDDTLFSSGGRYPAGIDTAYKRKVFYPGITALFRELDLGVVGPDALSGVWPAHRFGDLVFLSARPHVYKDLTETSMYSKFAKFMNKNDLHCMPSLLPGDLQSGQAYMMLGDYGPMAQKKALNFEQYYSIYPEFKHVFVGDNGQADVKAAEFMVEKFGRNIVERVYIHQVQPIECTYGYEPGVSENKWKQYGIVFCKTYVQAAIDAATCTDTKPLILPQGLRRVVETAKRDFLKIQWTWKDPYQRDTKRTEMNQDIEAANKYLVAAKVPPVATIPGECVFVPGTRVHTGFGIGVVGSYRPHDGMYQVFLDWNTGASDPPVLYAVMHNLFPTDKRLKQMQKVWFGPESAVTTSFRKRTSTAELDGAIRDLEDARGNLQRKSSVASVSTASDTSVARHLHGAGNLLNSSFDSSTSVGRPSPTPALPGTFVPHASSEMIPGYMCRVIAFPGVRAWPRGATPTIDRSNTPISVPSKRETEPALSLAAASSSSFEQNMELLKESAQAADNQSVEAPEHAEGGILEVGTRVDTPYGKGIVLRFRMADSIYQIILIGSNMHAFVSEVNLVLWNPKIFQERASAMVQSGSYPSRLFGVVKSIFRRDQSPTPTSTLSEDGQANNNNSNKVLAQDTIVKTPYGQGRIVLAKGFRRDSKDVNAPRASSAMYQVELVWGAQAYLQPGDVSVDSGFEITSASAQDVEKEASPLQRAKKFVGDKFDIFKLPFSALGFGQSGAGIAADKSSQAPFLPTSESLMSLSSMVSAISTTSSSSFFSLPEEQQRLGELWKLREGDQVNTPLYGLGTILEIRADGFFVVQLSFGKAYINVPRVLALCTDEIVPNETRVVTPYGVGIINEYRPTDSMYSVKMERWAGQVYISRHPASIQLSAAGPRNGNISSRNSSGSKLSDFNTEEDEAGPIMISASKGGRSLAAESAAQASQDDSKNSESLKSSIFSFISNILPAPSPPEPVETAQEAYTAPPIRSPTAAPQDEKNQQGALVVGHTAFSWEGGSSSSSSSSPRIPPGHTTFSWTLLQQQQQQQQ